MKRANEASGNAKQRKKQKQQIAVQQPVRQMAPRMLEVVEAIEARQFEIKALEGALDEFNGAQRVFQTVQRHMRRRAASHNVKRLPRRLQQKALHQMDQDNPQKKALRLKLLKKRVRSRNLAQRPSRQSWLAETHVWHAKRMKMGCKWGFKLALHPNDKSFRSMHRAASYEAVLHDASYLQPIQLIGKQKDIVALLDPMLDPTFPSCAHPDYIEGNRHLVSFLHRIGDYPNSCLGKVELMWRQASSLEDRYLWLWLHPSGFDQILQILTSISLESSFQIRIDALKSEFLRFELFGPRSHAILSQTLQTTDSPSLPVWNLLKHIQSPACLQPGCIVALNVYDPRLSFPIKMPKRPTVASESLPAQSQDLLQVLKDWPAGVASSSVWEASVCNDVLLKRPSAKLLDSRRSKALLPGTKLTPTDSDCIVPILLVHRASAYSLQFDNKECSHGWDVIVPKGWGMDFWKTFVFAGARVGGLRDVHHLHFESGMPSYPQDYPETPTYVSDAAASSKMMEDAYNRKPIAKRPNYKSLGVASPFKPDFELLAKRLAVNQNVFQKEGTITVIHSPLILHFIFKNIWKHDEFDGFCAAVANLTGKLVSNLGNKRELSVAHLTACLRSCFVRATVIPISKGVPGDCGIIYKPSMNDLEVIKALQSKSPNRIQQSTHNPVLVISLTLFLNCQIIRLILIIRLISLSNAGFNKDDFPPNDNIIGYVTTGSFSFESGKGQAISTCSLRGIFDTARWIKQLKSGCSPSKLYATARGVTGRVCRPVTLKLIP